MSKKIKTAVKAMGIVLIFIGAFVSLTLRKDLGDTQSMVQEETIVQEEAVLQEQAGTEDATSSEKAQESIEVMAQDPKLETEEVEKTEESALELELHSEIDSINKEEIILVNWEHPLPKEYEVELKWLVSGREQVAAEIYDDLYEMLSDGTDMGLQFVVASGYRSVSEQQEIWDDTIRMWRNRGLSEEEAAKETSKTLAYPGESEHATGLAVDIVSLDYQNLDDGQHDTKESTWLRENCYKYGFILRYPKEKEKITGITYESWHFRYVGKEAAKKIMRREITLEEYLNH